MNPSRPSPETNDSPSMPAASLPFVIGTTDDDAMTAALDEAMAKLTAMDTTLGDSPSENESASQPSQSESAPAFAPESWLTAMRLIQSIAKAATRREALKQLVASLASLNPDANVRGGLGRGRLSLFIDHRLGWLGPESSLQQRAADQWAALHAIQPDAPAVETAQPSVQRTEHGLMLRLPMTEGSERCLVWIEGPLGAIDWLPAMTPAIASTIWSRPRRSWPSIVGKLARRSTSLIVVGLILVGIAAVWPVAYRVKCSAAVETIGGRFVSAPFEATLDQVHVKPGDRVTAGQVLLVLDGRPLRLERESLSAEIGTISREYDVAIANRKIAEGQQAALRRQQLTRKLELITDRLSRLEVVSPIDGIIVNGDLEKNIGSPLELGQALFEVAPLERMRVQVQIPEHEIAYVEADSETRIWIDAVGGPSIQRPLERIFPQSEVVEDENVFIGQIDLENQDGQLRPGMRGEAIVYGPPRPWVWSWVRTGIERVLWWGGY